MDQRPQPSAGTEQLQRAGDAEASPLAVWAEAQMICSHL